MPISELWPFRRQQTDSRAPVKRQLSFSPVAVPTAVLPVGSGFLVHWNANPAGSLSVTHIEEPNRILWSTIPGQSFVTAAAGEERITDKRGSINVNDRIVYLCTNQTVEQVFRAGKGGRERVVVEGTLFSELRCRGQAGRRPPHGTTEPSTPASSNHHRACKGGCVISVPYRLVFEEKREHHLAFEVTVGDDITNSPPASEYSLPSSVKTQEASGGSLDGPPEEPLRCFGGAPVSGQLKSAEYVADWLAHSDCGPENEFPSSDNSVLSRPAPENQQLDSTWQDEELEGGTEPSGAALSEPSSGGDILSSHSQWSADSSDSDALSSRWWSLSLLSTRGVTEAGSQGGLTAGGNGKKPLLPINRVQLTYATDPDEHFFGFGEQFSHFDLKGKRVPIIVQEQGIGRGDQPITFLANLASPGSGGSQYSSYAAVPHYITSTMRSVYLETYEYAVFDLRDPYAVQVRVHSSSLHGRILHGTSPAQLIERYTATIGRMRPLPKWLTSGAVVGMQGGTTRVREVLSQLRAHSVPVSAFWLQDWVGQRRTSIGWQLWWNWQLDRAHYPDWENLAEEIKEGGAHLLAYVNPFLAQVGGPQQQHYQRDLFQEATARGFLVQDRSGRPYMVQNTSFSSGMVDLTNVRAMQWLKDVIKTEMVRVGFNGWMADFGESLPFDCVLHSGEDPAAVHNRYPEMWAQLNREVVNEIEAERAAARASAKSAVHKRLLQPSNNDLESPILPDSPRLCTVQEVTVGSLSSSFSGSSSLSSSWATLPSDESGDHSGASQGRRSPSRSPDPFAVFCMDGAEESVEPFVLDASVADLTLENEVIAGDSLAHRGFAEALTEAVSRSAALKGEELLPEGDASRVGGWKERDDKNGANVTLKGFVPESTKNADDRYSGPKAKDATFHDRVDGTDGADTSEDLDGADSDRPVFFMRAGYRSSPGAATLFWLGDQMTSWQRHDGIKSAVTGLLSGGLSGFSLNHSDIGGYCSVSLPGLRITRSEELLLRWMELSAFTPVFRTHEGNLPEKGAQVYSNERTLAHFGRMARVYVAWDFYRQQLMQEAASTGLPVCRHLFLHYPADPNVHRLVYEQFLVGDQILVAPVLDPGTSRVRVYLPGGQVWEHVWSGKSYAATTLGKFVVVDAPLGLPAVFVREGSKVGRRFRKNLREQGVL